MILPILEVHINGLMLYVLLCLASPLIISMKFFHVAVHISSLLCFIIM